MRLERTFHPVGHGAFYTERFYNDNGNNVANIVFDCGCYEGPGSGKSKPYFDKQINDIVDTIFPLCEDKTKIAALFISHFHTDHINGIPRLLNNCKVERIIMPKLTDDLLLEVFLYEIIYHQFSAAEAQNTLDSFLNTVKHIKIEVEIDCSDNDEAVDFEEIEIDKIGVGYLISSR
jgi:phosphoribosyl 1,2-cyclic phosphodiesterase